MELIEAACRKGKMNNIPASVINHFTTTWTGRHKLLHYVYPAKASSRNMKSYLSFIISFIGRRFIFNKYSGHQLYWHYTVN
ncbi:hypothetical protein LWI28_023165 [Acer negundo]|uniref:Uncharacterized protein n=1 Tax=Acer negundo TaxID=4023 RepID=A0AAD5P2Y9_ACENE|nr:hypothetical protein LWI28_023165 [Acer negundo]